MIYIMLTEGKEFSRLDEYAGVLLFRFNKIQFRGSEMCHPILLFGCVLLLVLLILRLRILDTPIECSLFIRYASYRRDGC
jgi:hypothetical protein